MYVIGTRTCYSHVTCRYCGKPDPCYCMTSHRYSLTNHKHTRHASSIRPCILFLDCASQLVPRALISAALGLGLTVSLLLICNPRAHAPCSSSQLSTSILSEISMDMSTTDDWAYLTSTVWWLGVRHVGQKIDLADKMPHLTLVDLYYPAWIAGPDFQAWPGFFRNPAKPRPVQSHTWPSTAWIWKYMKQSYIIIAIMYWERVVHGGHAITTKIGYSGDKILFPRKKYSEGWPIIIGNKSELSDITIAIMYCQRYYNIISIMHCDRKIHGYRDNVLFDSEIYVTAILSSVLELYITAMKMFDGRQYAIIATT